MRTRQIIGMAARWTGTALVAFALCFGVAQLVVSLAQGDGPGVGELAVEVSATVLTICIVGLPIAAAAGLVATVLALLLVRTADVPWVLAAPLAVVGPGTALCLAVALWGSPPALLFVVPPLLCGTVAAAIGGRRVDQRIARAPGPPQRTARRAAMEPAAGARHTPSDR